MLLCAALVGVGTLITDVLTPVRQFDAAAVRWFVAIRTEALTTAAVLWGHLGGTAGIVLVLPVAIALSLALTRRWRPPLFLLIAVAGETAVFLATATLVERARPAVDHLSPTLPPTSSFPSATSPPPSRPTARPRWSRVPGRAGGYVGDGGDAGEEGDAGDREPTRRSA